MTICKHPDYPLRAREEIARIMEPMFDRLSMFNHIYPSHSQSAWLKKADAVLALSSTAGQEWRDISSAPKDGSEVLLAVKMRANIPNCRLVGHWMPGGHCIDDHPPIDAGWYFWNGCMFDKASEPTGWMPLPAPPVAEPIVAERSETKE